MLYCKPTGVTPCIQFDKADPYALNNFLMETLGKPAEFLRNGTAVISSIRNGDQKYIFVVHGSWVRYQGNGEYISCRESIFKKVFELTDKPAEADQTDQAVNLGVLANMSPEQAKAFADKMNGSRFE